MRVNVEHGAPVLLEPHGNTRSCHFGRSANGEAVKSRNLSFSRGVNSMFSSYVDQIRGV